MKIGFIGCGNMASAMISGMLKKGLYKKDEIMFPILQKKEANEAEKSWEWLQPWITMKW